MTARIPELMHAGRAAETLQTYNERVKALLFRKVYKVDDDCFCNSC